MAQFLPGGRIAETWLLDSGGSHADFGTDGILAWGRRVGNTTTPAHGALTFSDTTGVHYVVGMPTPTANMPQSGTATYTLIGSTRPTFVDGSIGSGVGQLTLGQLTIADWSKAQVLVDLRITMPNSGNFSIGGTANISGNTILGGGNTGLGGSCPFSGCSASVEGFFAGTNAERAGLTYEVGQQFLVPIW
jgi:hypothetical protein